MKLKKVYTMKKIKLKLWENETENDKKIKTKDKTMKTKIKKIKKDATGVCGLAATACALTSSLLVAARTC